MKCEFPYKIKFYANSKWQGKLKTNFWDECIHKGTIQKLNNRREEDCFSHQFIPAQSIFLQTMSFETAATRNNFVVPWVLIDSYCHVILLNKSLNLQLLPPVGNSLMKRAEAVGRFRGCWEMQQERSSPSLPWRVGHSATINLDREEGVCEPSLTLAFPPVEHSI